MKSFSKMVYPYAVWMIIMIIVPMLMIVLYAFTTQGNDVLTFQFTLSNFARFFSDNVFPSVLWRSLKMAVITTLICILIGYPAAYAMAKSKPHSQAVMVLLITLPMWINMLVRTYAWKGILSDSPLSAEVQVYIGMVYNFLPFMVLPIYNALEKIDKNVINAARDLGADGRITFLRVIFPLSLPGVISGVTMVFIPALTTFVVSSLLGGGKILLIGNVIEQEFMVAYDWNLGSGLSLVLLIFIIINVVISAVTEKGEEAKA